jgi:hypothetical protein
LFDGKQGRKQNCGYRIVLLLNLRSAFSQDERGDNADEEKADDLDEHVAGGVNRGKAVPVPVRHVGGDGGQNPGEEVPRPS